MRLLLFAFLMAGLLFGCNPYENPFEKKGSNHQILVYSGITMGSAILKLKKEFEQNFDCEVLIMYGASGYLKQVIEVNRKGDIFFPGNASYIETFKKDYVVTRQVDIGYNTLSFFAKKGNPLQLSGDINQLLRNDLRIVLGSKDAGSVGKETQRLLKAHNIMNSAYANAIAFSTDSKGLVSAIKNDEADLTLNWRAVAYSDSNKPYLTPVEIDSELNRKVPIAMGLLKYSSESMCANSFMDYAISPLGKRIFKEYGFSDQ